jgi:transcription elongation factor Elf1
MFDKNQSMLKQTEDFYRRAVGKSWTFSCETCGDLTAQKIVMSGGLAVFSCRKCGAEIELNLVPRRLALWRW